MTDDTRTPSESHQSWIQIQQPDCSDCKQELRSESACIGTWLARALDEIDYGVVLMRDAATVIHANRAARAELHGEHPLHMNESTLRARRARDRTLLSEAIGGAVGRGLRRMLTLGAPEQQVIVSVVPVATPSAAWSSAALVVIEKRQPCAQLSVQAFARCHGLTLAETAVLQALCDGMNPIDIARLNGVAVCTIRSQIGSVRAKTGAASIRELLGRIAALPPLGAVGIG